MYKVVRQVVSGVYVECEVLAPGSSRWQQYFPAHEQCQNPCNRCASREGREEHAMMQLARVTEDVAEVIGVGP